MDLRAQQNRLRDAEEIIMIKSLHTALLTALVMLFLMLLTGLSALSEWEAKEQV